MLVKIKQGQIKGKADTSLTTGRVFYSFLGIPYAEPPAGELRFQPPVPAKGWVGIRDATYDRNRCIQLVVPEPQIRASNESEDCLYLNIFTPDPPSANAPLKPVIVFLHGGGFNTGTGDTSVASFDHLADYDVILVSLNYRLHILGFLNLNTPSCTGNCGCKDQILALRWVRENIRNFGGDPENVTLCGVSAGAICAHLLSMSPLAKGLFHKIISESGAMIGTRMVEDQDQVDAGFKIGRQLGFVGTEPEELVKFLKEQSAETLTREAARLLVQKKTWSYGRGIAYRFPCLRYHYDKNQVRPCSMDGFKLFVPTIERASNAPFLPDYPINLISTSQTLPMIAGVAEKEGVITIYGLDDHDSFYARLKSDLTNLVKWNVPCDPSKLPEITEKMKRHYLDPLGDNAKEEDLREKFIEIYSHLNFLHLYDITEGGTKSSVPLYVYKFNYAGHLNDSQFWSIKFPGVLHCDEAGYIFLPRESYPNGIPIDETDRTVIRNLCTAWTNFARTPNPNPLSDSDGVRWHQHTVGDPIYMLFDGKCTSIKSRIWNEGLEFWKEIFRMYGDWSDGKNRRLQL